MISQTQFNSVLFVEDDLGHAMLIKRALKGHVSEVHHCESVSEAREILKGGLLPELIITDLKLPDSSHVEHVAELQALTHGRPVLVLTSSTSLDDVIAAMKLGAKDFIVKNRACILICRLCFQVKGRIRISGVSSSPCPEGLSLSAS